MFKNLKIITRLLIIISLMFLATLAILAVSFSGFSTAKEAAQKMFNGGIDDVQKLFEIKDIFTITTTDLEDRIHEGLDWNIALQRMREGQLQINKLWDEYFKNSLNFDKNDKALRFIEPLQQDIKKVNGTYEQFQDFLKNREKEPLSNYILKEVVPFRDSFNEKINSLVKTHVEDTRNDFNEEVNTLNAYKQLMIILFLVAWGATTAISVWIVLGISKSISNSVDTINRLAQGDTSDNIVVNSNDEIGTFLQAMQSMIYSSRTMSRTLAQIADGDLTVTFEPRSDKDTLGHSIVSLTEKLKRIIEELQTEVGTLTSSAQEIVASVQQVSANSSETAAAVNETTTTIEELKQTAHLSSEKANDVLASAEETLQIVKTSEKALQGTLEDMNQINEKMYMISEGIVKLSEHSQAIRDIIDTVNDLAEQSNLLAVNAAIEAAKAGEQGKSFGVVAQEIRSLAEQSKAATVQVRSILNDIQNATSAAVMATEQGSKATEKGLAQSSQTRESMHTLLTSIANVAQAANQISLSSKQQLVGVDQVTIAMNNIREATTHHVDQMKQIETAVNSLNAVGFSLKEIVERYILNTHPKEKAFPKRKAKVINQLAYSDELGKLKVPAQV